MRLEQLGEVIVASSHSSSSSDPRLFGLLLFLSGFIFYGFFYLRYRNTDKRHMHESETEAKMLDVRGVDQHINTLKGLKNSKMEGANNHDVRGSSRGGAGHGVMDAVNSAIGELPGGRNLLS
jgi:hypothetical protein